MNTICFSRCSSEKGISSPLTGCVRSTGPVDLSKEGKSSITSDTAFLVSRTKRGNSMLEDPNSCPHVVKDADFAISDRENS